MQKNIEEIQLNGLKWTLNHVYRGSQFYRDRFDKFGVKPNDIKSLDDLKKLPFTTADDLKDNYPYPFLSVPFEDIVRLHASSGTTGKRKVLVYTKKDIDDWATMVARCYKLAGLSKEDRIQICVGYGVWTAGVGFQLGCEKFGAFAIPAGPGNLELQMQFLVDLKPTVICATASMALLMAEEVDRRNLRKKINVKKVIFGAERSSMAMRDRIKELFGAEDTFDIIGLIELYGPGMGLDCKYHTGVHYWADYYIVEIINFETLQPAKDGEVGELVYTTLCKEGSPLIRYRSRDLSRFITSNCSCSSEYPQHDRILGRCDDMFIVRGVNIYPSNIDIILAKEKNVSSEYQIHIDRKEDSKDYMTIKVERNKNQSSDLDEKIAKFIQARIKKEILVSGKVQIVNYGELQRTARKAQRVFDNRKDGFKSVASPF